jgi:hypothetical protein
LTEQARFLAVDMNFTGIDLYTNRFTCCYREEKTADFWETEPEGDTGAVNGSGPEISNQPAAGPA